MPQGRERRLPQRTCIACRSTSDKRGFVRTVRTPGGSVEIDLTGKKAGRGAYLCPSAECWEQALKKGRIEAALKVKLTADDRLRMTEFAATLREAVAI
jgi:predicted RNA-binding protein YlxR (DUF448 family)